MRFRVYKARTIQMTKTITTRVPINPYPNIVVSSKLKIVGFRNPMSYSGLLARRFMSHLAHNANNPWETEGSLLRISK
jgi:hypothetical protein